MKKVEFKAYNPAAVEKKWQEIWERDNTFEPSKDH